MGVSTDAYLFYGVEIYIKERGDGLLSSKHQERMDEFGENVAEYVTGLLEVSGVEGVEVDYHAHGDYPVYYLSVKKFVAWRGYSKPLTSEDFIVTEDVVLALDEALDVLGVPEDTETHIGWHLASYWG